MLEEKSYYVRYGDRMFFCCIASKKFIEIKKWHTVRLNKIYEIKDIWQYYSVTEVSQYFSKLGFEIIIKI
jgi:hypothetical protein